MDAKGKKQVDLVRATGLDKGSINHYLSGKYEPKQRAINKLAIALDVSEMWLWGYDVPMERSKAQKNNDAIADIVIRLQSDEEFLSVVKSIYAADKETFSLILHLSSVNKEKLVLISQMLSTFAK
jgi:transcriptional regulator with XRE-family HTH domain